MVSTSYPRDSADWRGLFIHKLVEAIAARTDVTMRLWSPPGQLPPHVTNVTEEGARKWLDQLMGSGGIAHLYRKHRLKSAIEIVRLLLFLRKAYIKNSDVDLHHVNWLQNALPLPNDGRPLLVTALGTDMQLLKLPLMRFFLRKKFMHRRVAICPNADWMVPILAEEFGDLAKIECVPFGVDPAWFEVRRATETNPEKWVCVSRLTSAKLGSLFEWGEMFFSTGTRELHLFGPQQENISIPSWVKYHGPVTADELRSTWFPHATGLLTLSQHAEGRPQVMLEAMAAGLPILASNIAAHADFISHGNTGWLCHDQEQLGLALNEAENPSINALVGTQARNWVRCAIGTWDDCGSRYAKMYHALTEANPT